MTRPRFLLLLLSGVLASLTAQASRTSPESPVLLLTAMTFVGSEAGRNEIVVEARRARVLRDDAVAYLEQVRARVEGEGEAGFRMTCDRARYDLASQDFVAEGNVDGETGEGRRFSTSRLRYDHARGVALADVPVAIVDASGSYRGGGFRYHVRDGRFELTGGAEAVQTP